MQKRKIPISKLVKDTQFTESKAPVIRALVQLMAEPAELDKAAYYDIQRPRPEDVDAYQQDNAKVQEDWVKFQKLLSVASAEGVTDADVLAEAPRAFSGRLSYLPLEGVWKYTPGQYYQLEYRQAGCVLLDYAIRRVRQARPPQRQRVSTIAELKILNEVNGGSWFSEGNMEFFGTRIETGILRERYFITSEQPPEGARKFTIRTFDDKGDIDTVGEFCAYASKRDAQDALTEMLREEREEQR